jgi:hypothetical protein
MDEARVKAELGNSHSWLDCHQCKAECYCPAQRVTHLKFGGDRSPTLNSFSRGSEYSSPSLSGYQTPRELKEEQWRQEAHNIKPNKLEMRIMYKELGGRKSRGKTKLGSSGIRDKGGWEEDSVL